jgi:hypothetical protein
LNRSNRAAQAGLQIEFDASLANGKTTRGARGDLTATQALSSVLGLQRPTDQVVGAAVLGALIMTIADWFGRNLFFPYQLPVGLLAALVGGPYFLWLMQRPRA